MHILLYYRTQSLLQTRELKLKEMKHRQHPQSNSDFARLFNELDQWRIGEVAKIKVCYKIVYCYMY
jgi:hypothetical protein